MNGYYYYAQDTQNPSTASTVYMDYNDWNNIRNVNIDCAMYKLREERRKKAQYYSEQRSFGMMGFVVGLIVIAIGFAAGIDLIQYAGLACSLFGLYCIGSKHMVLRNEYYFEVQDKINIY